MQDIASLASPYSFSQETSGELIVLAVGELLVQVNVASDVHDFNRSRKQRTSS